jgi:hypothetical protein
VGVVVICELWRLVVALLIACSSVSCVKVINKSIHSPIHTPSIVTLNHDNMIKKLYNRGQSSSRTVVATDYY